MMGAVMEGYPIVKVTFHLPGQPDLQIECVVDTGFAGHLTLPPAAIVAMRLPFFYKMPTNLANNMTLLTDVHTATILWHGKERDVEVLALGRRPLIGRALLSGNYLGIDFRMGGEVHIELRL